MNKPIYCDGPTGNDADAHWLRKPTMADVQSIGESDYCVECRKVRLGLTS